MTIWYISTTGSDTAGSGSAGSPYATVEKCITLGSNGDTIKALTGTYTITSTTNLSKQITITSNTSNKADVIFDANCTIFNVQSSNVVISYLTLQSSGPSLVNLDVLGNGSAVPIFYTGFNINNCNIKYSTSALILNGTFSVTSNVFTRFTGSNVCDIIKVYSSRGVCSISGNTFTDSGSVRYVLYFTSNSSNAGYVYYDYYYSKGGTMTISSNIIDNSHASQSTSFIFFDYFNQYNYIDSNYNLNTKISFLVNGNTLTLTTKGKFIYLEISSGEDIKTLGICNINTNNISNTGHGFVHLGKRTNSSSITLLYLDRSVFKIYGNVSNTILSLYEFITSNPAYTPKWWLRSSNGVQLGSGNLVTSWVDSVNNAVATAYKMGSTNYPTLDTTTESVPFIKLGTDTQSETNGNYFDFGQTTFTKSLGFTMIAVVRFRSLAKWERIVDFANGLEGDTIVLSRYDVDGHLRFYDSDTNTQVRKDNCVTNQWNIYAGTITSSSISCYANTITPVTVINTGTLIDKTYDKTSIGRTNFKLWAYYANIDIRDIMIYEKGLSNSDISEIITRLKETYSI
jgi:hypothetical protein